MRQITLGLLLCLLLAACTVGVIKREDLTTVRPSSPMATPVLLWPMVTRLPTQTAQHAAAVTKWVEYWDPRYGYGLAIPCHWTVDQTPLEGTTTATTMMNYNENFVRARTDKGEWLGGHVPEGVLKIDLSVFEGINPSTALADVFRFDGVDGTIFESVQEKMIGSHRAVSAIVVSRENPSDKGQVIAFRMYGDKVLFMSILPDSAWESSDVKGILNSIVFSLQEKIVMPSTPPASLLAPVPDWCVDK